MLGLVGSEYPFRVYDYDAVFFLCMLNYIYGYQLPVRSLVHRALSVADVADVSPLFLV